MFILESIYLLIPWNVEDRKSGDAQVKKNTKKAILLPDQEWIPEDGDYRMKHILLFYRLPNEKHNYPERRPEI